MSIIDLKNFAGGGMDTDSAPELVAGNDYLEAYNVRNTGNISGEDGYVVAIESNTLIPLTLPAGINKCVGSAQFENVRKIYKFIYNSQNKHVLTEIDYDTDTEVILFTNLVDSNGVDVFNISTETYITDIKLVDNLLIFRNSNNEPCLINIKRLKEGGYAPYLTKDDFLLIKKQPVVTPSVVYGNDTFFPSNFLYGKLFQFREQYIYEDNESSVWGNISDRVVPVEESNPNAGTVAVNNNCIIVSVDAGDNRVVELNIASRQGNLDFAYIKNVKKTYITALTNTAINLLQEIYEAYNPATNIYSFVFYNNGLYPPVDVLETDLLQDYIPNKCEALEVISGRGDVNSNGTILTLGNNTEGYARPNTSVTIGVAPFNPNIESTPITFNSLRVEAKPAIRDGSRRICKYVFYGTPVLGDQISLYVINLDNTAVYYTFEHTVNSADVVGGLFSMVKRFSDHIATILNGNGVQAVINNVVYNEGSGVALGFRTRAENQNTPEVRMTSGPKPPLLDLAGGSTAGIKSIPSLKSNSSYQLALAYYDRYGRSFPVQTNTDTISSSGGFVVKTNSYAEYNGQIPVIDWTINSSAPEGAYSYQWLISPNTTHQSTTYVLGKIDSVSSSLPTLNINLRAFNEYQEDNPNTVVNYDFSVGDRVSFGYYTEDDNVTKKWFDGIANPLIDLEIVDYEIVIDDTDPLLSTYVLKARTPSSAAVTALTAAVGDDVLMELYSPLNSTNQLDSTIFYEIGDRMTITNGVHDMPSGRISYADTYFKVRSYPLATDLNVFKQFLVEDFNFSDFYESKFTQFGRPRSYYDTPENENFPVDIRYSYELLSKSRINLINRFYAENKVTYDNKYGGIKILRVRDNTLVCIQEIKVGYIPVNIAIIEDQIAQENVATSTRLLNKIRYSESGNMGIGNAVESFVEYSGTMYFIDPYRSEPIQISYNGVGPISGKMSKYFKNTLKNTYDSNLKIIGYYNIYNKEYIITSETKDGSVNQLIFNSSNWDFLESYTVNPASLAIVSSPTKGTLSTIVDGVVTYSSTPESTGTDTFSYSFTPVGGGSTITKNICIDILPGSTDVYDFSLGSVSGQDLVVYSDPSAPVGGLDNTAPVDISIVGGEYRINEETWLSTPGFFYPTDEVEVRVLTAATEGTTTSATLTIGDKSSVFNAITLDENPDAFVFTDVIDAELSTVYSSNIVTVTGISGLVPISIVGGEYRINSGPWTSISGTITNGQTAQVRRTSSSSYDTSVGTTLTVGTYSDTYSILTREALPVTVNYSLTKDATPHVDLILVPLKNSINIGNIYPTSTGTFSGTLEGDVMYMGIVHAIDYQPWPADSSASLVINKDTVEIYNSGTLTNPDISDLASFTFTLVGGSVYDVIAVSNSTSTLYTPSLFSMDNDSSAPLESVTFELIDNTDDEFVLFTSQVTQPQNNIGFNWLTDANTGKIVIENNSFYDLDFTLTNVPYGGAYNTTITVVNGMSGEFSAIPKTSYDISYIDTPDAIYSNIEISESFQKDDCETGSTGTYVTYTVPADTYTSLISQLDADNQAEADILANGQDYANTNATCLVDTINAIISVDMFNDATLDVCAYIDTAGVSESNVIAARDGLNFYLATDPAPSAYILASDNIAQTTLKRRFLFNIGKLIAQYPDDVAIPTFVFKIRGRSATAGTKTGLWQREFADVSMTMTGSPGTYIPTTVPTGGPAAESWSAAVVGGGDGTVGIGVGAVIMTFTYTRSTNTITLVTA
jgi:hypothetical protein